MERIQILKSKKLNITDFRLAVLKVFKSNAAAISVEQIEAELKDFDRITLYRTLKSFKEKGVIHEIQMGNDLKKYALCEDACKDNTHQHNHVHFLCEKCNDLFCVDTSNSPKIEVEGFKINHFEIQASGICINCN